MDSSKKWFILQFKPNSHLLAKRNLHRQGFESFIPMLEITKHKYNRYVSELRPLFPGYMFVAFNPESGPWRQINCTTGVSKLVCFGRRYQFCHTNSFFLNCRIYWPHLVQDMSVSPFAILFDPVKPGFSGSANEDPRCIHVFVNCWESHGIEMSRPNAMS